MLGNLLRGGSSPHTPEASNTLGANPELIISSRAAGEQGTSSSPFQEDSEPEQKSGPGEEVHVWLPGISSYDTGVSSIIQEDGEKH